MELILNIPHSSALIPEEYRKIFLVRNPEKELRVMTDWYTDELFGFEDAFIIKASVSRLIVDTERFPDDEDEPMAKVGMGAVYTHSSKGEKLKDTDDKHRAEVMERYYYPYHRKLEDAVSQSLERHHSAMIIDCHSFSSVPLPHESDRKYPRPDVCIGTDSFHTNDALAGFIYDFFSDRGYRTDFNTPFSGTIVPLRYYGKDSSVQSVMIEINRSIYMDEMTLLRKKTFSRMQSDILSLFRLLSMH